MCGLFGFIASDGAPGYADVFSDMGSFATTRGVDASGIVAIEEDTVEATIFKAAKIWDNFWESDAKLSEIVHSAAAVLGHVRAASVGNARQINNAHPFSIGHIKGMHNGTVDTWGLGVPRKVLHGTTDSEMIFAGLAQQPATRSEVIAFLSKLRGSAALVWVDDRRPEYIQFARPGMRPLVFAHDNHGSLWWASEAKWFKQVQDLHDITFEQPTIMPEGSLWEAKINGGIIQIRSRGFFEPIKGLLFSRSKRFPSTASSVSAAKSKYTGSKWGTNTSDWGSAAYERGTDRLVSSRNQTISSLFDDVDEVALGDLLGNGEFAENGEATDEDYTEWLEENDGLGDSASQASDESSSFLDPTEWREIARNYRI